MLLLFPTALHFRVDGGIDRNAHIFTIVGYPRRTLIFDQGDPSRTVYFVKRGTVRIESSGPSVLTRYGRL